jgi:hypothetical protein
MNPTEIYDIIINGYYTFNQYYDNINYVIIKIIKYINEQNPNLSPEEILESIKSVFIIEKFPLPTIIDSELLTLYNNPFNFISLIPYIYESQDDDEIIEDDNNIEQNVSDDLEVQNNIHSQIHNLFTQYLQLNDNQYNTNNNVDSQLNSFLNNKVNVVIDKNKLKKIRNRQYKFLADNIKQLNKNCTICLDDFENTSMIKTLPCNHAFHKECIIKWLTEENYKCTICRKTIGEEEDHIALSN